MALIAPRCLAILEILPRIQLKVDPLLGGAKNGWRRKSGLGSAGVAPIPKIGGNFNKPLLRPLLPDIRGKMRTVGQRFG